MKKALSANPYDRTLAVIYCLNVTDYLFTLVLISSGLFVEANPLLYTHINTSSGWLLKCILPLVLLTYLHCRLSVSPPKNPKPVRLLLTLILSYYALINAFHLFWLGYTIILFL